MDEPRRKTPMLPKSIPLDLSTLKGIGVGVAAALLAIFLVNTLAPPARLIIESPSPAATPAATPTYAAPTAAPAVAATPLPRPTEVPTMDLPPLREVDLVPPTPEPPPPPVVEDAQPVEVPAPPLVFAQGACAEWHPPQVLPEECKP